MSLPERPAFHLWSVAHAAEVAGLNLKLFVSAVHRGQMGTTEILILGAQGERYVRASSLVDFLSASKKKRTSAEVDPLNERAETEPTDLFAAN